MSVRGGKSENLNMLNERLDRQLRIKEWKQELLDKAMIGVVGDNDPLASLYVLSSSALGINNIRLVGPALDKRLLEVAQKINPELDVVFIEGFYTHPVIGDIFSTCDLLIDFSRYGLANKLLLEKGFYENIPIVRGFRYEEDNEAGLKVFTYLKGREWEELEQVISSQSFPHAYVDDGVLDIILSGIVLEETVRILMGKKISENVVEYRRKKFAPRKCDPEICVVGAGALGNFVGMGLSYAGFSHITIMDPEVVEITNLNRQVFFYDAVGLSKAETLSLRLNSLFETSAQGYVSSFSMDTDINSYDVVFDCVDNFETRIVLSEKCEKKGKFLISGGTSTEAGQVVVYDPRTDGSPPATFMGLYDIVDTSGTNTYRRDRMSCVYRPEPAVIMTNQIIAGFMVDAYGMLLDGQQAVNIFYDSNSDKKI